jgi:exodeoxyribonuclease VII small subunit
MNITYKEALAELTEIVRDIENENIAVDELAIKVKRAAELIDFCQHKLRNTDVEVKKILAGMEAKSADEISL